MNAVLEPEQQQQTGGNGAMTVRPHAGSSIGALAEQSRAIAEIQAALTVAQARPRDEIRAIDRIKTSCQRPGLAEVAEYVYNRGGTDITGPTIDLMTVIANCWGNIQFGFRELTQAHGESTVETFAWDLETNSKRSVIVVIPHKRTTKKGTYALTDARDIYEHVANVAQRRVRSCLEAIIPADIVEDAVSQCRETLKAKVQVTPESISAMVAGFMAFDVTKEQLEKRLGRRLDAMQPAQLVNFRRIYKSLKDGMSRASDWFEMPEESKPTSAAESVKAALKARATPPTPEPSEPELSAGTPAERAPGDDGEDLELQNIFDDFAQCIAAMETDLESNAIGADLLRERDRIGEENYSRLLGLFQAKNLERAATRKGAKK